MSKYEPLWKYINSCNENEISLSFDIIKSILGFDIDHSFLKYKKELNVYNYTVKRISMKEKKVYIEKLKIKHDRETKTRIKK